MSWEILQADCIEAMRQMDEASVDAIVTDPPYHLTFMGRTWDHAPSPAESQRQHLAWTTEALRVLKPGGHLLAFGGTRTYHRLACAIEDAGFEIRDCLVWMYGSGFPKSLDVSKAIDKHGGANIAWFGSWLQEERKRRGITRKQLAVHFPSQQQYAGKPARGGLTGCVGNWETGVSLPTAEQFNKLCEVLELDFDRIEDAEREVLRERTMVQGGGNSYELREGERREVQANVTAPATPEAAQWEGFGTSLKPAHEPVVLARKPLIGTVASNCLEWGTGALNIDGCRIDTDPADPNHRPGETETTEANSSMFGVNSQRRGEIGPGRWPANVALSHFPESICETCNGTGKAGNVDEPDTRRINDDLEQDNGSPHNRSATVDESGTGGSHQRSSPCGSCGGTGQRGCRRVGTRRVKSQNPVMRNDQQAHGGYHGISKRKAGTSLGHADPDGTETIPAYQCAEGCPIAMLDEQSGELVSGRLGPGHTDRGKDAGTFGEYGGRQIDQEFGNDRGGASRFFYCAKSSRAERNAGLEGFEPMPNDFQRQSSGLNQDRPGREGRKPMTPKANGHPTVKPIDLMRWLVRLVTPPGGTVLDPFTGSGTTGCACVLEGFDFIGIEREPEYVEIAMARIAWWEQHRGREADEVLAESRRSEAIREVHESAGQLGLELG